MSKRLIYLVSFVFAFGLCGSIASGQENQIINGEFDEGLEPWGIYTYLNTTEGFTASTGNSGPISNDLVYAPFLLIQLRADSDIDNKEQQNKQGSVLL